MDVTGQDAPPRDGGWGAPTHYSGRRTVERPAGRHAVQPAEVDEQHRAGAPAGPEESNQILAATLIAELTGTLAGDTAPPWGATTYIGPGGRPAPQRVRLTRARRPARRRPTRPTRRRPAGAQLSGEAAAAERSDRGLFANTRAIALASLASRVTGFLRSVLLVAALGAGGVSIAYNSGNNLPNMIYELLLGGVLSSVLIPLLVQAETEDEDGGLAYTQRLLSIATAALAVLTALAVTAAPWIAAAFVQPGHQRDLTATFAALLLPEIFFYGLGAMFMAVLNIKHVYGPGAWAPLLNNLVVIATVLVFWAMPGPKTLDPGSITTAQVLVVGIGTSLGIAAQALVLIPSLRSTGFRWAWRFRAGPDGDTRLRQLGNLGAWVLGYVVVSQIGVSVIQRIGNDNGGFTVFTTADLLFQMPYGILVVSVLTAIMPRLSRAAVRDDRAAVIGDLALGARLSAVALVPVTVGLLVLGAPLGITLFAHGQADVLHAHLIGSSLAWSAFGLFPFALVMLQLRVFYAMRDGRTPTS